MLGGYLSAHEEAGLIQVAQELGLHRDQAMAVHATNLDAMAIAAWADGVVTDAEVSELRAVAQLLGCRVIGETGGLADWRTGGASGTRVRVAQEVQRALVAGDPASLSGRGVKTSQSSASHPHIRR